MYKIKKSKNSGLNYYWEPWRQRPEETWNSLNVLSSSPSRELSLVVEAYFVIPSFALEEAMAPHSSTLAWKIPWTEEPARLQSMGVAKSQTWLSDFTFAFHFHALEKEMATHSSVLAWRIPGTGEPGGPPSNGVAQSRTRLKWLSSSFAPCTSKLLDCRITTSIVLPFKKARRSRKRNLLI